MEELRCGGAEIQEWGLAHEPKIREEAQGGEEWGIYGQVHYVVQQWQPRIPMEHVTIGIQRDWGRPYLASALSYGMMARAPVAYDATVAFLQTTPL